MNFAPSRDIFFHLAIPWRARASPALPERTRPGSDGRLETSLMRWRHPRCLVQEEHDVLFNDFLAKIIKIFTIKRILWDVKYIKR